METKGKIGGTQTKYEELWTDNEFHAKIKSQLPETTFMTDVIFNQSIIVIHMIYSRVKVVRESLRLPGPHSHAYHLTVPGIEKMATTSKVYT